MPADAHPPPPSAAFGIAMTEAALLAIAVYHVIELHFLLYSFFLRKRNPYFWSVLAATWGVALNGLGTMVNVFYVTEKSTKAQMNLVALVVLVGWYLMVTGQSLVLFSRLHLVTSNHKLIRGVLYMIITTVLTLHLPVTVIVLLQINDNTGKYTRVFDIYEPVQLNIFTVQELIISGIYIYYAFYMLRPIQNIRGKKVGVAIRNLIYINVFIIILDIAVASLEYAHFDNLQHFFKAAVYSLKLKIEFIVLNQLLDLMQKSKSGQPLYRFEPMQYPANNKSVSGMEMGVKNNTVSSTNRAITTTIDEHREVQSRSEATRGMNPVTVPPPSRPLQSSSSQGPFADQGF